MNDGKTTKMKDPAALLYIDIWKMATTEMDAVTRAYYMDLILHQYDKGSLPNDIEELANICRVRFSEFEQFEQVFEQVLKHKFKLCSDQRLRNEFASNIIRKRENFKKKRKDAGRMSYFIRYITKRFSPSYDEIEYIKKTVNLDGIDLKNEQVLEQVFEQVLNTWLNKKVNILNEDEDVNNIDNSIITLKEKKQEKKEKKNDDEILKTVNEIMKYFHFTEMRNPDKMRQAFQFVSVLNKNDKFEYFQLQFPAYKKYKEKNEEKIHTFNSFIGTIEESFLDGGWNLRNWEKELKPKREYKSRGLRR